MNMTMLAPSPPAKQRKPKSPAAREPWRPERVKFTIEDIELLSGMGIVPQKSELVDGEIYAMAADGNFHSVAIVDLYDELRPAWPKPKFIRNQSTHRFSSGWAPMPDLLLTETRPVGRAKVDPPPVLVIEVSDTTLAHDLGEKRLRYAREGVPEYWVADLNRRRFRVFRDPDPSAADAESAYRVDFFAEADATVSPLAVPALSIRVSDVLPAAAVSGAP